MNSSLERVEATQARLLSEVQSLRQDFEALNKKLARGGGATATSSSDDWRTTVAVMVVVISVLCQVVWGVLSKIL